MMDRPIEWDEEKNAINKQKHKIGFEQAAYVFADPNRKVRYDALHSDEEDRWHVIGRVGRVLFVVCTERGETIRIISARYANAKERRIYYGNS